MITHQNLDLIKIYSDVCHASIYVYQDDEGWLISSSLSGEWWNGKGHWTDREEKAKIYGSKEEAVLLAEQILDKWEAEETKYQDALEYEKLLFEKERS